MKKTLEQIVKTSNVDKLVIHSIDLALYQASVLIDGVEYFIANDDGSFLTTRSLIEMQKKCRPLHIEQQFLRHASAYDEMIGTTTKKRSNALEVPIKDSDY
ncbi:DUF6482 family protein [Vibrio sonorensis]|uniref:DUF6482 family protein n=1 Tax=Vibrio sonorensis TaxID=1004316 RepID=UPI0008D904CA|nr:DUF6482 family protein [Vibrio sonorensis]